MVLYSFNITSDPISEGSDANRVFSYMGRVQKLMKLKE